MILRPGDFRLNATCALWYGWMQPPKWAEAAHYSSIAVALRPENPELRLRLADALSQQGRLDDAVTQYREAIRIKKDLPDAHNNLGVALREKGQLDEAIAEYREALRLNPDPALARFNLRPAEQMAELSKRLPAVLEGRDQPRDAAERLAFAQLCQSRKKLFAAAAGLYAGAFSAQPQLAEQPGAHRYNAACAAALARCGQGKDVEKLEDKEKARLRGQALDWLRADLKAVRLLLEKEAKKAGPYVIGAMRHWLADSDFAGVRGPEVLAKLPQAERQAWQQLWKDVAETLEQAQQKSKK
jgi:tetratricopeptide (TPR) repeat protein